VLVAGRANDANSQMKNVFLTAEWRDLVMLNYETTPAVLRDFVPRGTELDAFDGKALVSLVGFRFLRTRLFGAITVPFHVNFDEINLRFYVRRRDESGEVRRGVVFIREVVPRWVIALIARLAYNEHYSCHAMRHRVSADGAGIRAKYEWRVDRKWIGLHAEADGAPALPADGSIEQFISEHYWGYSRQRDGSTVEYQVTHPQWRVWRSRSAGFEGDCAPMYGPKFGEVLTRPPDSAFIADGSKVSVFAGKRIA
jgi:uncharacterized protein YqjF (DUF2071 family)